MIPALVEPQRADPNNFEEKIHLLYDGVRLALRSLSSYFRFDSTVSGIDAVELHNLNSLMGSAIEVQVVETLNRLRAVWDTHGVWGDYFFIRSPQSFPDVRLVRRDEDAYQTILGIELKGWFLLAKEGVPSLRYKVSPSACNPWDLICVVPWFLNHAVSGVPQVSEPWIEQAKYAAEWRDYWWQTVREGTDSMEDRAINYPVDIKPYPSKADQILANPEKDAGGNFGRLPRCRPLMDDFVKRSLEQTILGIPAQDWQLFLKLHSDRADSEKILSQICKTFSGKTEQEVQLDVERLQALLRQLTDEFKF